MNNKKLHKLNRLYTKQLKNSLHSSNINTILDFNFYNLLLIKLRFLRDRLILSSTTADTEYNKLIISITMILNEYEEYIKSYKKYTVVKDDIFNQNYTARCTQLTAEYLTHLKLFWQLLADKVVLLEAN